MFNSDSSQFNSKSNAERELPPELVEAIERSPFGFEENTHILLVGAGLKPAALVHLTVVEKTDTNAKIELTDEEIEGYRNLLKKIGNFKEGRRLKDPSGEEEVIIFMLGDTPENLEKLSAAIKNNDERQIGLALGYSETEIGAYCGDIKALDESNLPNEVLSGELAEAFAFKPAKLSAEHYREELAKYQKWADYIKRVSPSLYNRITGWKPPE